jgi:YebC/PmpR family DNA-binding regulatory protein
MSGHSKWSQIKHQKGVTDQKRGELFSKLLNAVSIAAKTSPNPEFNPRLRAAILKAKENNVPLENIDRAIKRALESHKNLDELIFEAYGPGGAAILIKAISDNKNKTIAEVKKILSGSNGKWAESGSVIWAFEKTAEGWKIKFNQPLNEEDKTKLKALLRDLRSQEDVREVYVNVKL